MKQKWKVERSQKRCAACKMEFVEGANFFSALYPAAGGGFIRRDFCFSCWPGFRDGEVPPLGRHEDEEQFGPMPAGDYLSFWKTRISPPEKKKPRPRFDPRIALTVFTQVLEREEKGPDEVQLLFILALSLVRRKVLRMKGLTRSEGRSWMRLAKKGGRKEYLIEDPGLSEQDILSLLDRVGELLEMNIDGGDDDGDTPADETPPDAPGMGGDQAADDTPGMRGDESEHINSAAADSSTREPDGVENVEEP